MIEGLQRGFLATSSGSLGAETVASEPDLVAEAQEVLASATGTDKVELGVIQKFIEQLPEKILVLGVRVLIGCCGIPDRNADHQTDPQNCE